MLTRLRVIVVYFSDVPIQTVRPAVQVAAILAAIATAVAVRSVDGAQVSLEVLRHCEPRTALRTCQSAVDIQLLSEQTIYRYTVNGVHKTGGVGFGGREVMVDRQRWDLYE